MFGPGWSMGVSDDVYCPPWGWLVLVGVLLCFDVA